jgi:hypothetical protein
MKKKELVVFQMFGLLAIFLFGMTVGVQGMLSVIWRDLNALIISRTADSQELLKSLQTTSARGLKLSCILGVLIAVVTVSNILIFSKKYRGFLNSLEK